MIAGTDAELMDWLYGVLDHSPVQAGGFLYRFAEAASAADDDNYLLLRPVLLELARKYPTYSYKSRHEASK